MAGALFSLGLSLGREFLRSKAQSKAFKSQAKTHLFNAQALRGEADDIGLETTVDLQQLAKFSAQDIAEVEAQFAESGQSIEEGATQDQLLASAGRQKYAALIRRLQGAQSATQKVTQARSSELIAQDLKKASQRTFLGGLLG